MATEDFTTYTEVDPNSDIAVTASRLTIDTMRRDVAAYVKKDYGAIYFRNFKHDVATKLTAAQILAGFSCWGVSNGSNTRKEMGDNDEGQDVRIGHDGSALKLQVQDHETANKDDMSISLDTTYYLTITRVDTSLTVAVYSDAARTTLLDTLSITCGDARYQYVFGVLSSAGAVYVASTASGWIEDLALTALPPAVQSLSLCLND